MENKKAQGALEFMILTSFLLLAFTVFFLIVNEQTQDKLKEKENLMIKQIVVSIQDEINLASQSTNGYERTFKIPENLNGENYTIGIGDDLVYIKTLDEKFAIALPIAKVEGNILKGTNKIKKENEVVTLNG